MKRRDKAKQILFRQECSIGQKMRCCLIQVTCHVQTRLALDEHLLREQDDDLAEAWQEGGGEGVMLSLTSLQSQKDTLVDGR